MSLPPILIQARFGVHTAAHSDNLMRALSQHNASARRFELGYLAYENETHGAFGVFTTPLLDVRVPGEVLFEGYPEAADEGPLENQARARLDATPEGEPYNVPIYYEKVDDTVWVVEVAEALQTVS